MRITTNIEGLKHKKQKIFQLTPLGYTRRPCWTSNLVRHKGGTGGTWSGCFNEYLPGVECFNEYLPDFSSGLVPLKKIYHSIYKFI